MEEKNQTVVDSNNNQIEQNLYLYNQGKEVPETAQKEIKGGKLKGFTDINPVWRIKRLTEMFGPCGKGWKAPIVEKWTENGAGGEIIANVKINLFYKENGEWQEPIEGIGGSMLITTEKGQLVTNDEAYKMAYTDAISVACKMLGIGANIYYDENNHINNDRTKYDAEGDGTTQTKAKATQKPQAKAKEKSKYQIVKDLINGTTITFSDVEQWCKAKTGNTKVNEMDDELFNTMIKQIQARINKEKEEDNQTPWDED